MFCYNCGKQIPDSIKFCCYCGAAQKKDQSAPASAVPPHARAAPSNNRSQQNRSSGNSVFSYILSFAIIAIVVYFIFFSGTDNAASPAPGASSQIGLALDSLPTIKIKSPGSSDSPSSPSVSGSPDSPSVSSSPTLPQPSSAAASVVDQRIPDYRPTNPQWEVLRYEWDCLNNRDTMWLEVSADVQMYTYYRNLARYLDVGDYYRYVVDENNREMIRQIVSAIQDVGDDLSYTDMDLIQEIVKFVQDVIEYEYDTDSVGEIEYPRYPIETLYERRGDCEDTSILLAAMLKELGYEVGFLDLPNHIAVAVRATDDYDSNAYYEINGHRYVYIESTGSGWKIGDIPEDFQQTEAEFFLIP